MSAPACPPRVLEPICARASELGRKADPAVSGETESRRKSNRKKSGRKKGERMARSRRRKRMALDSNGFVLESMRTHRNP